MLVRHRQTKFCATQNDTFDFVAFNHLCYLQEKEIARLILELVLAEFIEDNPVDFIHWCRGRSKNFDSPSTEVLQDKIFLHGKFSTDEANSLDALVNNRLGSATANMN